MFWGRCLHRMQRHTVFHDDASPGILATTGVPEGDALSVVAAVAFCWMRHMRLTEYSLRPTMFFYNSSWSMDLVELNSVGISETRTLTDALCLQVDWSKSIGWSVHAPGLEWWHASGPHLLPAGSEFQVLRQACVFVIFSFWAP